MVAKIQVQEVDEKGKRRTPWWWRKRIGLTPFYFGLASVICGWLAYYLTLEQTWAAVLVLCSAAIWGSHRNWGRKKDRAMRNYVTVVVLAFGAFVMIIRTGAVSSGWVLVALLASIFGLGAFWWADKSNLNRVRIERDQERWPDLAKTLGMPHVRRGWEVATETGRKWQFHWEPGKYTLEAFKAQQRQLESALNIPDHHIIFEPVYMKPGQKDPNRIVVVENTNSDISKGSVPFEAPTMKSFTDPMLIGKRDDNTKHEVVWYHRKFGGMHTLAAGATGSGKSGLYNLVMGESAYCNDLVRWGIDAKGGMALRPWASMFDWMIDDTSTDELGCMLTALLGVLRARSKYAADKNWECWRPDADHPILLFIVDEAAEIFGMAQFDTLELMSSIARMGRAAGVLMLLATQMPTNEAIGSTQVSTNLRRRFCFSVENGHAQQVILGTKSAQVVDATEIPVGPDFVGTYFCSDGGQLDTRKGRVRFVDDNDKYRITMTVGWVPGYEAPGLDTLSEEAARKTCGERGDGEHEGENAYDARRIWTVKDVKMPEEWVGTGDEPWLPFITGAPGAPVHAPNDEPAHQPVDEPADEPAPMAAMRLPDAPHGVQSTTVHDSPVHRAPVQQRDPMEDVMIPEGTTRTNLDEIVVPQNAQQAAEYQAALAEWNRVQATANLGPAEAQAKLDEMLAAAGAEGVAISEMGTQMAKSPSWYSEHLLKRLRATPPTVERVGNGRWRKPRNHLQSV